ncbi:hypothetical protein G6F56_001346 [Rhizopus delemar]|nr:hypothetical protein G6F56_001346 [Rhizopus delemar]
MYNNWDTQSKHLFRLKWYKVDDLIKYLDDTRTFVTRTPGKLADTYLPTLVNQELPVDHNKRFPETEDWLCEGLGEWNVKYDMLQLALNVALSPNRLGRVYPKYKTQGDTEFYCVFVINELLQLLAAPEPSQVIKRHTFEQKYGFHWEEKQHFLNNFEQNMMDIKQKENGKENGKENSLMNIIG